MQFDPSRYGPEVEKLLALDGAGQRLMPLEIGSCSSAQAKQALRGKPAGEVFPQSYAPEAALSGLWLYFSCFDEAHTIAQDIPTADGSYWHGILHRQEPDAGNAAYWFRRVGQHPVFPLIREVASELGFAWDPFAFIDFCEEARRKPGSEQERIALEIQRAEWQALFDYCARPQIGATT